MVKNELRDFMSPVYRCSIILAAFCQLVSLLILGWNPHFLYGITLGICISIVNHNILSFTVVRALNGRWAAFSYISSYMLRMIIYGGAFYVSYNTSLVSGIATILGYLVLKAAIYYTYGFKPGFSSKSYKDKKLKNKEG